MAENKEPFTQVARALRKPRERSNGKLRPLGSPSNPFKFASLRLTFFFFKEASKNWEIQRERNEERRWSRLSRCENKMETGREIDR